MVLELMGTGIGVVAGWKVFSNLRASREIDCDSFVLFWAVEICMTRLVGKVVAESFKLTASKLARSDWLAVVTTLFDWFASVVFDWSSARSRRLVWRTVTPGVDNSLCSVGISAVFVSFAILALLLADFASTNGILDMGIEPSPLEILPSGSLLGLLQSFRIF